MVKNYNKGKVYKIVCRITGQIYIGSTCVELLSHRLREHTYACKAFLTGERKSNTSSYKIIVYGDYYIELIENYPCRSKDELTKRERAFYDSYDCINTNRPFVYEDELKEDMVRYREKHRGKKAITDAIYRENHKEETKRASSEWYLKNRELVIERSKTHYEENKESISETRKTSYQKNKESIKQEYLLNKESILAKKKIHRDANRDRVNAMKLANYHKNKNKVKVSLVENDLSVV
jgi:hypothetical protein